MPGSEKVRVLRLIEYSGPREAIEEQLHSSLKNGTTRFTRYRSRRDSYNPNLGEVTIKIATLGDFPEILERSVSPVEELAQRTLQELE